MPAPRAPSRPPPAGSVVPSKNSSSVSFSLSPRTNCRIGLSRPGRLTSPSLAVFSKVYSVGLNWTSIGSPIGAFSRSSFCCARRIFAAYMCLRKSSSFKTARALSRSRLLQAGRTATAAARQPTDSAAFGQRLLVPRRESESSPAGDRHRPPDHQSGHGFGSTSHAAWQDSHPGRATPAADHPSRPSGPVTGRMAGPSRCRRGGPASVTSLTVAAMRALAQRECAESRMICWPVRDRVCSAPAG